MKTKAIIVDDEKMARMLLKGMVNEYLPDVEVVSECPDLPTAVKAIIKYQPELVFLDIEMPGHSGLELLDFFDDNAVNFSIIFTTAYNQYAIQAFKLSAIDYLLKPIDPKDLIQSYELFQKNRTSKIDYQEIRNNFKADNSNTQKLAVSSLGSVKYIPLDQIVFIQADGSYSNIFLENGQKVTASKGLKFFEDALLNHNMFMRCQKSNIINLTKVTELIRSDGGSVVLNNTHNVSISVDKLNELNQRLKEVSNIL